MVKVRRMLTEILLGVTNEEIEDIVHEVVKKERQKALKGIHMFSWVVNISVMLVFLLNTKIVYTVADICQMPKRIIFTKKQDVHYYIYFCSLYAANGLYITEILIERMTLSPNNYSKLDTRLSCNTI
jgi:hypothetical protein